MPEVIAMMDKLQHDIATLEAQRDYYRQRWQDTLVAFVVVAMGLVLLVGVPMLALA